MESPVFEAFRKIPRLYRDITIQEKVDGTNAQILISETLEPYTLGSGKEVPFMVGSRNRWIQPENDNYGFATWAYANAETLLKLGPGHHFGEWFGAGIQRKYGLSEKRFALFNTKRWNKEALVAAGIEHPQICVVPVLYEGMFDEVEIGRQAAELKTRGSQIVPGFPDPEGIIVFHHASGQLFKYTLDGDGHKG